jgi:hypothetical protein
MDIFARDENHGTYSHVRTEVMEEFRDRVVYIIGPISDSNYLARDSWTTGGFQNRRGSRPEYSQTPIVIADISEQILQDSIHVVRGPNAIVEYSETGMYVVGLPPYQFHDRIRILDDGTYMIAREDSALLHIYNSHSVLERTVELNIEKRPVEEADIEYWLRDIPRDYHQILYLHFRSLF